jgi:hypothetical protein
MTDGQVRVSPVTSGRGDEQQDDSASALVEMITRQRELERTGTAETPHEAGHAEPAGRSDTDASNTGGAGDAPHARGDVPGARPERRNYRRRQKAVPAFGQGATTSAADALLTVFAIDEEQWAKLLADLPLDTVTELLGHAFRLYQRIAVEETNRRFERDTVAPPESSSFRAAGET